MHCITIPSIGLSISNILNLLRNREDKKVVPLFSPIMGTTFCGVGISECSIASVKVWANHVILGEAGWTPDYSYPLLCTRNFSGTPAYVHWSVGLPFRPFSTTCMQTHEGVMRAQCLAKMVLVCK